MDQLENLAAGGGGSTGFLARLRGATPIVRLLGLRQQYKRFEPAGFFAGGVMWDVATLQRIDALIDNVILSVYLIAAGILIAAAVLVQSGRSQHKMLLKYKEALPAGVQFLIGALFSAYVVFYFQSASWTSTSVFLFLLVGLLVANEFAYRRIVNVYLQFALYYLATFSFFVFSVPIITKSMSYGTFLAAGILSTVLVAALLLFLHRRGIFEHLRQLIYALGLIVALFAMLNVFYLKNWIPPVPLALRHAGIYHSVQRQGEVFELRYEKAPWYQFWVNENRQVRFAEGDAVHCFAAVFAPTQLRTDIYHEWQYYDEAGKNWVETDRMHYNIEGLRDGGYRWYSRKRHIMPGRWRVYVRTANGRTLGRIAFVVENAPPGEREFETLLYD